MRIFATSSRRRSHEARALNRCFTNAIRLVLDELLLPILRDSRWFMYPFYRIAYRGNNVDGDLFYIGYKS